MKIINRVTNKIVTLFWSSMLKNKIPSIGVSPRVNSRFFFENHGRIKVGDKLSINSKPLPVSITVNPNAELVIGNNVNINYGADIGCTSKIEIGNDVYIGNCTLIIDSNFHKVEPADTEMSKEIKISENVWIAARCIILPGVTIGRNSVIAAGSVVTKNVPENVLVAGVPAKIIKKINIPDGWIRRAGNRNQEKAC